MGGQARGAAHLCSPLERAVLRPAQDETQPDSHALRAERDDARTGF